MNKVIIYPNERGGIAIVYPAPNCGISIEEIARKDVPAGLPHLIIDEANVPADMTFFDAFEADFSEPHGHGIGAQAWFIEQYEVEIKKINTETAPATPKPLVAASKDQAEFPEDFTPEQIDAGYEELVAQVAALNEQIAAAHAEAVAQWETGKVSRIDQLNKLIDVQRAEMEVA